MVVLTKREIALMKLYDFAFWVIDYEGKLRKDSVLFSKGTLNDLVFDQGLTLDDFKAVIKLVEKEVYLAGVTNLELSINFNEESKNVVVTLIYDKDEDEKLVLHRVDKYLTEKKQSKWLPSLEECIEYIKSYGPSTVEGLENNGKVSKWLNFNRYSKLILNGYYKLKVRSLVR